MKLRNLYLLIGFGRLNELLGSYYNFLSCNELKPYVRDIDLDDLDIEEKDKFYNKYMKIYDDITNAEKNRTHREVLEIVLRNAKQNIGELNKKIATLFKMDEDFKQLILDPS